MGKFLYEDNTRVDFEDRLLFHLQTVIGSKLRRGESFFFSWRNDVSIGGGRETVWMHPQCSIRFKYHGSRQPSLSKPWLEALSYVANSPNGLHVVPEPNRSRLDEVHHDHLESVG